jgi:hypothetical protein
VERCFQIGAQKQAELFIEANLHELINVFPYVLQMKKVSAKILE